MGRFSIVLLCVMLGCAHIQVETDVDPSADFSTYHTYRLATPEQGRGGDQALGMRALQDRRIRGAIDESLTARGLRTDATRSDLMITYRVTASSQAWGGGAAGATATPSTRDQYDLKQGTLVIDFVDSATGQRVWRGFASGAAGDPDQSDERVYEAALKILEEFPLRDEETMNK